MQLMGFWIPILSIVTYVPLAGALAIVFLFGKERTAAIKAFATAVVLVGFLVSLPLWFLFERGRDGYQFVEKAAWIPSLGVDYQFGIDGISLVLILLTTLMGIIAVACSYTAILERQKEYYVLLLLLQTFMIGTFCSLDLFLFYVFWEVMLVPMYFLIGVWGSDRRLYAAIKFFLYTLAGSVLMLLGIIALYFYNTTGFLGYKGLGQPSTFSIEKLTAVAASMPVELQIWLFFAFFFSFAIKVPMFPFHTWLPDAHTEAPTAGSVILAAVLLKMGTYGFVRFSLPMFPDAITTEWVLTVMVALSIIGIVYGAMVTLVQKDMKRLIAYSSVSHLGFVMLGVFALNMAGLQGGILQMVNHGISTGALFLLVGMVYERRHTRMIEDFGGLSEVAPWLATAFVITALASIGLPGTSGFVGEFLALLGTFETHPWIGGIASLGVIFAAYYMLPMVQRIFFDRLTSEENRAVADLSRRELVILAPLIALMIWIGVQPAALLRRMEPSVQAVLERVRSEAPGARVVGIVAPEPDAAGAAGER